MNKSLVWVQFFLLVSLIALIMVPRPKIVRLLPFGLVGGLGLALIYTYLFVNYFNYWEFNHLTVFSYAGIPLFLSSIWIPMVIIFAHLLSFMDTKIGVYALIGGFAVVGTMAQYFLGLWGFMKFHNKWNLVYTFALSLSTHIVLAFYLVRSNIIRHLQARREIE